MALRAHPSHQKSWLLKAAKLRMLHAKFKMKRLNKSAAKRKITCLSTTMQGIKTRVPPNASVSLASPSIFWNLSPVPQRPAWGRSELPPLFSCLFCCRSW
eukprot:s954_g1.t1